MTAFVPASRTIFSYVSAHESGFNYKATKKKQDTKKDTFLILTAISSKEGITQI